MPDYSNYNSRTYGEYGKIWRNTGKCVFCDLKDKYIIAEMDDVVLTVNIFPYIVGHLLIIPRRHFEAFEDMNDKEIVSIKKLADKGRQIISECTKSEHVWFLYRMARGYGSQKTVPHVHAHLIPYSDDLFKWEYQNIDTSPEEIAKEFRKKL